jgi:carboxyl-terminal processing protease
LAWDQVPPTDFVREPHVGNFVRQLQAQSEARVAEDKDFDYLHEDIAQFKKSLAAKTVSLNEADRRQEIKEAKAREDTRIHERAARKDSQPITYEITVENAEAPGLPAPAAKTNLPAAKLADSSAEEAEDAGAIVPQRDPDLHETERILADYAAMLRSPALVTAAPH